MQAPSLKLSLWELSSQLGSLDIILGAKILIRNPRFGSLDIVLKLSSQIRSFHIISELSSLWYAVRLQAFFFSTDTFCLGHLLSDKQCSHFPRLLKLFCLTLELCRFPMSETEIRSICYVWHSHLAKSSTLTLRFAMWNRDYGNIFRLHTDFWTLPKQ